MTSTPTSVRCSFEQKYWRGVLRSPPIGVHPDKADTVGVVFYEDAEENIEACMLKWRQQELVVFGSGPAFCETEHRKSYVACRQDALSWLSYILLKYDATHLLPKAVVLLDAYVMHMPLPGGTPDGVNSLLQVERPKHVASNEVLVSLVAIVQMTVKMAPLLDPDSNFNELLAVAVVSGILDCAARQPRPLSELRQLVVHEEQRVFAALRGLTWLATPLDWANAYLSRITDPDFHCRSRSRSKVHEWANKLLKMIPVTQMHPSSALGLAACVLGLIHSGILKPCSAWEVHLEFMQVLSNAGAFMQLEHFTKFVSLPTDEVLACMERTLISYSNEVLLCIGVDALSCQEGKPLQPQYDDVVNGKPETTACDSNSVAESEATSAYDSNSVGGSEATEDKVVLMINKIPRVANAEDLLHYFKEFNVRGAHIPLDRKGFSRCYGFLLFPEHAAAQRALDACTCGQIILPDHLQKSWVVEAKWACKPWNAEWSQRAQPVENDANLQENEKTAGTESIFKTPRSKCNFKPLGRPDGMDCKEEVRFDDMNGKKGNSQLQLPRKSIRARCGRAEAI